MSIERILLDSGIFLKVLLGQERAEKCRIVIEEQQPHLTVSDFALHAIGLILLRNKRSELYSEFFHELAPRIQVLTLPVEQYPKLLEYHTRYRLDFDDAYQLAVAGFYNLDLLTLDSDFMKVDEDIKIHLLR